MGITRHEMQRDQQIVSSLQRIAKQAERIADALENAHGTRTKPLHADEEPRPGVFRTEAERQDFDARR